MLASREAKGGAGMVALAGEYLNLVLEDLKLHRDLKVNRVTQPLTIGAGTFGPFALESDYLRTYDLFYQLQGPTGETQFLTPITMEQYDAEFKGTPTADYPYEFATDLSTQAQVLSTPGAVTAIAVGVNGIGYLAAPALGFVGPGTGAAASANLQALAAFQSLAGVGYLPGDIVTAVGGTYTRPATARVTTTTGNLDIVDGGEYTVLPGTATVIAGINFTGLAGTIPTTGGSGTGMALYLTWGLAGATVTAGGSGYTTAPTVTPTGGTPNTAGTLTASVNPVDSGSAGDLYIFPASNGQIVLTHRYMKDQPDIVSPETSTEQPWFNYSDYLVKHTAARLMGITGDDRQSKYLEECEVMLRPHLIMEGDEQQTVRAVRLDPRHFKSNRGLRPTKLNPY